MKKNIIFDVGDVLMQYRWRDMLSDIGVPSDRIEEVGKELFQDPKRLWEESDLGRLTPDMMASVYAEEYPSDADVIDFFIHHGEYMNVPRPRVWREVSRLHKSYHIYLLSNYSEDLFRKHTMYADFMKDIDGLVVSYMIHEKKPNPAIYKALLEKYSLDPSECVFFDDRIENVDGARSCGIDAVHVPDEETLLKILSEY
jgi:putative hydrolase of the HAD superfamily